MITIAEDVCVRVMGMQMHMLCTYMCMCMCMCISMCCVYVWVCVCVCVCAYVRMCAYVYVCMCVCVYVCMCVLLSSHRVSSLFAFKWSQCVSRCVSVRERMHDVATCAQQEKAQASCTLIRVSHLQLRGNGSFPYSSACG